MEVIEKKFQSSDGITPVTYYFCKAEGNPKAIVQICHGMTEYFKRYLPFAEFLNQNGIIVCGTDHVGHGKSVREGVPPGHFEKGEALSVLVDDEKLLFDEMKKTYKYLPYVLLGHSMGSFIARLFLEKYHETVNGAIICGTAGPDTPVGMGIFAVKLVSLFTKKDKPSPFLQKVAFGSYDSKTGSKLKNSWLTRNEEVVKAYNADPLCGFPFTPASFLQLFSAIKKVNREEWFEAIEKSVPIFLVSGKEDPVGNYGKGVTLVYEGLLDAEITNLEFKLYEQDRHEILNELNKEEVYNDFLAFILKVAEGVHEERASANHIYFDRRTE